MAPRLHDNGHEPIFQFFECFLGPLTGEKPCQPQTKPKQIGLVKRATQNTTQTTMTTIAGFARNARNAAPVGTAKRVTNPTQRMSIGVSIVSIAQIGATVTSVLDVMGILTL